MQVKRKKIFNVSNTFVRVLYSFRKMAILDLNYRTLPYFWGIFYATGYKV